MLPSRQTAISFHRIHAVQQARDLLMIAVTGLAVSGCMSTEPAAAPGRTWAYSPYASGSQSNPIAIEVPDSALSGAAPSGPKTQPQQSGPILAERQFETNLELFQILPLVIEHLQMEALPGGAAKLAAFIQAARNTAEVSNPSFPSQVVVSTRACGRADGALRQWAETRFCNAGLTRYDELRIETFASWRPTTNVPCSDCVTQYTKRLNALTIDTLTAPLGSIGYTGRGVIEGGRGGPFPSPLVHSGFVRGPAAPLLAASHRPLADMAGKPLELPPAVFQLQIYFPASAEN
jgi:hypothetical protein